ncbi:MAG: hypothetical protein ACKOAU_01850 [Pirellula sp.]
MNRKQFLFPAWMFGVLAATLIVLLSVCTMAVRTVFQEQLAGQTLKQLRLEASNQQPLMTQIAESIKVNKSPRDAELLERWQSIMAQVANPYLEEQLQFLKQVPDVFANSSTQAPESVQTAWSSSPDELRKFIGRNTELLDLIYEHCEQRPGESPWINFGPYNSWQSGIADLVFLDGVECLSSKDLPRFRHALEALYRFRAFVHYDHLTHPVEPIVFLLHRGLDEQLIGHKDAAGWLERFTKDEQAYRIPGMLPSNRASLLRSFDRYEDGIAGLPSIHLALFTEYEEKHNRDWTAWTTSMYLPPQHESLKYFTLALRVALIDAFQSNSRHPESPEQIAKSLVLPKGVRESVRSYFDLKQMTKYFSYQELSPTQGELRFELPSEVTTGEYPVAEHYRIDDRSDRTDR